MSATEQHAKRIAFIAKESLLAACDVSPPRDSIVKEMSGDHVVARSSFFAAAVAVTLFYPPLPAGCARCWMRRERISRMLQAR
jgi:hypothetical protein